MYTAERLKTFVRKCPICDNSRAERIELQDMQLRINCVRCGDFICTHMLADDAQLLTPAQRTCASHALRKAHRDDRPPLRLSAKMLEAFSVEGVPNPRQKLERLIVWIGDTQPAEHAQAEECTLTIAAHIGLAISDATDQSSFGWLLQSVEDEKLFEAVDRGDWRAFRLTMKGWKLYEDLKRVRSESRKGFMAMKFNDTVLDKLFDTALKPGALRAGFELYKLTDNQPAGQIDAQLKAALLGARFVVADLSHKNDGAYWEAGFGEGRGIPVIYACEKTAWEKAKTHFDTNHMVTIIWEATNPTKMADDLTALLRNTFREDAKLDD